MNLPDLPQQMGISLDSLASDTLSLLHRGHQLASRGILVPTAIEELGGYLIAWEIIHRTKAHQDAVRNLRILAQRDGELQALDAQWFVDKPFQVTLGKMVTLHLLACHTVIAGMQVLEHMEFSIHQMTTESNGIRTVIVEYLAIYLVLVDALGQQLAYYDEYRRVVGVIGKPTGIGHHATIDAGSPFLVELLKATQLPYDSEDQLTGAARMRT